MNTFELIGEQFNIIKGVTTQVLTYRHTLSGRIFSYTYILR